MADASNGLIKKGANGSSGANNAARRRPRPSTRSSGVFARLVSISARLLIWYSIVTIAFRCPQTLEACDDDSPQVCKLYFQAKQVVAPQVAPYYDTYAAPYVDFVKPYYETVDRTVITPARTYAVRYGGPQLATAQAVGLAQWKRSVQPQLAQIQDFTMAQYKQTLAPHIEQASTALGPYYDIARTNALQTYHDFLLPSYLVIQPYALQSYETARVFTAETAIPGTLWAWNRTSVFLDSTVWPQLRDVYELKVEPQLLRIGERLGRYNEKKGAKTVIVEDGDSTTAKSTFARPLGTTTSPTSAQVSSNAAATSDSTSTIVPADSIPTETAISSQKPTAELTKEQIREASAKEVKEDLESWEAKFTQAAQDGAEEIEERVREVSTRAIDEHAQAAGASLVHQLREAVETGMTDLKNTILSVLEQTKDGDKSAFDDLINTAVRSAGLKIKHKAQEVRTWRESYEKDLEADVTQAAAEHILIVESIRDLAMQKIGMKWAWMDGVTHKDWQKYHKLRNKLDGWVEDLKGLVTSHPGLADAQAAGLEVENDAMAIAGDAAQALGRLKQVAGWKRAAEDYSNDFDASTMELAAEAARKKAAEAIVAASKNIEDGAESISKAISAAVVGSEGSAEEVYTTTLTGDDTVSVTVSLAEVTPKVDTDTSALPPLESMSTEPTESASNLASDLRSAATPSSIPHAGTSAAESVEPLSSSKPIDGPEQVEETIIAAPAEPTTSATSETKVKSAFLGAAAQSAPSRQPILDGDIGSSLSSVASVVQSDVPASVTAAAQSAYTAAILRAADSYSSVMSAASVQISGKPKPAHEQMFSSASSAYFDAIASADAKFQDTYSSASQGVSSAAAAASVDWDKVQSVARKNLDESMSWASERLESAKVAIGAAEPTPSTAGERAQQMLDQAQHNYYAAMGVAHARYSEFLSAASTAMSSLTATPTPTNLQESASSAASAASGSAASAASVVSDGIDSIVSRVSSQVYGASQPFPIGQEMWLTAESLASQASGVVSSAGTQAAQSASSQYVAVSSLLSELLVGKEPTFTESVYSRLQDAYSAASETAGSAVSEATKAAASAASSASVAVSSAASAASESASAATEKVKETAEHIIDEL